MNKKKEPGIFVSLLPVIFLIIFLSLNVGIFGDAALDGSNQIVLILSAAFAAILGFRHGTSWTEMQDSIVKSISSAMSSMLILLLIGSLAGTWMISGIVPAMIYYGLQIIHPIIFLFAAVIVCSVVSMATGSSWTTAATVGIALIGIGKALGISEGLVAGAILSGAYFGDKMSPLSDTTNLAPAMAGTDLFTHIRYMALTTIPSIILTLIIFLILGFTTNASGNVQETSVILNALSEKFNINFALFLVPIIVVVLIVKKAPALPALLGGTLLGAVFALIFQPHIVSEIGGNADLVGYFKGIMKSMYGSVSITTSNNMVNELLTTGGMAGMLNTIWLILSAMIFGGIMEGNGFLRVIASKIASYIRSTGSLVTSTIGTCFFFNVTASDQYLAIVVPGRMYADLYKKKGLAPENLSRSLEDSGTVTSVLIPWNTCGAYHTTVLGVSTFAYAPYCFFNIISPFMSILFAYLNIKIKRIKP